MPSKEAYRILYTGTSTTPPSSNAANNLNVHLKQLSTSPSENVLHLQHREHHGTWNWYYTIFHFFFQFALIYLSALIHVNTHKTSFIQHLSYSYKYLPPISPTFSRTHRYNLFDFLRHSSWARETGVDALTPVTFALKDFWYTHTQTSL